MTKELFKISQIIFNKMQSSGARTLSRGLKKDPLWRTLSGTEHQMIGRIIAKYHDYFAMMCPIDVKINYSYTDMNGNGIYAKF